MSSSLTDWHAYSRLGLAAMLTPMRGAAAITAVATFAAISGGASADANRWQVPAEAREPGLQWLRQFGTNREDWATGVAATPRGIYVSGWTYGRLPGKGTMGSQDAFLRKYRADGHILWTRQFGTDGSDFANAAAVGAGAVYVVGETDQPFPGQRVEFGAFLRSYDASGKLRWMRQFAPGRGEFRNWTAASGVTTHGNSIYVVGETSGSFPGFRNGGLRDTFLRRYDQTGRVAWTRQFAARSAQDAVAVRAAATGVYVLVYDFRGAWPNVLNKYSLNGRLLSSRRFSRPPLRYVGALARSDTRTYVTGSTGLHSPSPGGPIGIGFLTALDERGRSFWVRRTPAVPFAVTRGPAGIYITGSGASAFPDATGEGSHFIRRYDSSGDIAWTHRFGGSAMHEAAGLSATRGGIYVAGTVAAGPAIPGAKAFGQEDAYVARLSP